MLRALEEQELGPALQRSVRRVARYSECHAGINPGMSDVRGHSRQGGRNGRARLHQLDGDPHQQPLLVALGDAKRLGEDAQHRSVDRVGKIKMGG